MSSIVLFDGVCNFCNGAVNFIIRHDHEKKFKFAPLQSEFGEKMRAKFRIGEDVDSIILVQHQVHLDPTAGMRIENGTAYLHSTAGLKIAKELGFPWSLGFALIIVPSSVRDWFYMLFAKYRYKFFGRKDVCMMPTPELKERFLSEPPA